MRNNNFNFPSFFCKTHFLKSVKWLLGTAIYVDFSDNLINFLVMSPKGSHSTPHQSPHRTQSPLPHIPHTSHSPPTPHRPSPPTTHFHPHMPPHPHSPHPPTTHTPTPRQYWHFMEYVQHFDQKRVRVDFLHQQHPNTIGWGITSDSGYGKASKALSRPYSGGPKGRVACENSADTEPGSLVRMTFVGCCSLDENSVCDWHCQKSAKFH